MKLSLGRILQNGLQFLSDTHEDIDIIESQHVLENSNQPISNEEELDSGLGECNLFDLSLNSENQGMSIRLFSLLEESSASQGEELLICDSISSMRLLTLELHIRLYQQRMILLY